MAFACRRRSWLASSARLGSANSLDRSSRRRSDILKPHARCSIGTRRPRIPEPVEGVRAEPRLSSDTAPGRLGQLPRLCLSRASTTEAEVPPPTKGHQRPTRVISRSRPAAATTRAPANHRNPSPQAKARSPAEGDSKELASRHLAPFRRHPRCRERRSRDSPSEEPAAGTRPVQRGKGVVRFSEGCRSSSAIRTRSRVRRRST